MTSKVYTQKQCSCGGLLLVCTVTPRGKGIKILCLGCGYRFYRHTRIQMSLNRVNRLRLRRGLKRIRKLRERPARVPHYATDDISAAIRRLS